VWHDIDDLPEPAPRLRLAEQGALTSDSIRPHAPPSRLSSEPLRNSIGAIDLYPSRARSEATTSARPRSPPPCSFRASPENQLSQEGHLHTGRGVADEHQLVGPARNADPVDERERQQEEGKDNNKDASSKSEHPPSLQGASVGKCRPLCEHSVVLGTEAIEQPQADPDLLDCEADSMAPMQLKVWPRASARELSRAINEAGCDSHSGDELNNTESDEDDKEPRPMKRKRPSSSQDGLTHKKSKHLLPQRSTGQHRPHSKLHARSLKSHSPLDQASRIAALPSPQARPSAPNTTDTDMPPDYGNLDRSSRAVLPTLDKVTFRPHSPHCCSFTAVIRDGCDERGVSLSQLGRLIASIGHVGTIEDLAIKPMEQYSLLVTGFSQYKSSPLSSRSTTVSTTAEAGRAHKDARRSRPEHGKVVDAEALASQGSESSSSDDDGGDLSDSDPELSSDGDGCLDKPRPSTRMNIPWSKLDEQRLLAWKKEGKSWKWVFGKFPDRTEGAVRTRHAMIQRRVKSVACGEVETWMDDDSSD
jgi:hypothetical protein